MRRVRVLGIHDEEKNVLHGHNAWFGVFCVAVTFQDEKRRQVFSDAVPINAIARSSCAIGKKSARKTNVKA